MVFGIHIKKSPMTPKKVKDDFPTFHFDTEDTTPSSYTKKTFNKAKSVDNLRVDDDNNVGGLGFTASPISRRHSHHMEPKRRLGSCRMRKTIQKQNSHNGENETGSDLDEYDFMEQVKKQRSRSFNTHHEIPDSPPQGNDDDVEDSGKSNNTSRLKIKSVSFVTHSGCEFHVRERSK